MKQVKNNVSNNTNRFPTYSVYVGKKDKELEEYLTKRCKDDTNSKNALIKEMAIKFMKLENKYGEQDSDDYGVEGYIEALKKSHDEELKKLKEYFEKEKEKLKTEYEEKLEKIKERYRDENEYIREQFKDLLSLAKGGAQHYPQPYPQAYPQHYPQPYPQPYPQADLNYHQNNSLQNRGAIPNQNAHPSETNLNYQPRITSTKSDTNRVNNTEETVNQEVEMRNVLQSTKDEISTTNEQHVNFNNKKELNNNGLGSLEGAPAFIDGIGLD